jgi:hypothetical protein
MNKAFTIIGKVLRIAFVVYKVLTGKKPQKNENEKPSSGSISNEKL